MSNLRLPHINRVMVTGRLTRDPEVRYTPSGHAVATLGLAVNRPYKDAAGAWQEETAYLPVVLWDQPAELAGQVLKKGSALYVEGRLTSRSWETPEGQKRQVLEVRAERVQFLERPEAGSADAGGSPGLAESGQMESDTRERGGSPGGPGAGNPSAADPPGFTELPF